MKLFARQVPQEIFLADRSVRANIAFGTPEKQIHDAQVERAARIANIHDFVTAELIERSERFRGFAKRA